ncbi:TauD/TfdA family dioxygenase [Streptosporangium amethystogenes]|uniref:TauD/TfdA family dioxygenase n=1 Tax=Streptosporangium amethystogenes TaxID=2002 RepID=UPI0004CACA42|nr:TauD/TfdA family dioxygenase [Streptosporangium amethystogenes]
MTTTLPTEFSRLGSVTGHLEDNGYTAAVVYPVGPDVDDHRLWTVEHRKRIQQCLRTYGAVLLTDLPVDLELFSAVVRTIGGEPLAYNERSTPRTEVGANIYTSTEYPPDQAIPMHNENSYSDQWPSTLFFLCHTAPKSGGATPIADSRAVLQSLGPEVQNRFARGVLYTRTFREGLGLSWQEAFQTDSRERVEQYCRDHGQRFTWTDGGLRTRHWQPAWRREPSTGAEVWFNQANLFHVSALDEEIREALALYDEEDLPRNAYLGDGSTIEEDDLAVVGTAYEKVSLAMPWRTGSILMINNMLMAHGREAFTGDRRILVSMA